LACGPELDHGGRGLRKPLHAGEKETEEDGGADVRDRPGRERKGGRVRRSVRKREREGRSG
jgi:hypothetical protein